MFTIEIKLLKILPHSTVPNIYKYFFSIYTQSEKYLNLPAEYEHETHFKKYIYLQYNP